MVDEEGNILLETGRKIFVGDEFLTANNDFFRVYKVENTKAYAKFIKKVDLNNYRREETLRETFLTTPIFHSGNHRDYPYLSTVICQLGQPQGLTLPLLHSFRLTATMFRATYQQYLPNMAIYSVSAVLSPPTSKLIAIYHTHNAESFVPTDGTYSIDGKGGIHEVGKAFKTALEERGINVIHDETLHLPHDRGAYRRSRETAQRLLSKGPDVIFDVHRDAAPMNAYAVEIEDEWVTKVMFIVGRQNQNFILSKNFAYDLKGHADYI